MAGHSHWAGIRRQKEVTDKKRARVFSKLLRAISAAARTEPNPDFNPRLRTAIEKAKSSMVPADNIERAVKKASEVGSLEEFQFEAYGPGGVAVLIEALSDSRNRIVQEIKKVLSDFGGKWAEPGSVLWAFSQNAQDRSWSPSFPQEIDADTAEKLSHLEDALLENEDVQRVTTSAS